MAWLVSQDKIKLWIKQYWYILLILLLGVLFMIQPSKDETVQPIYTDSLKEEISLEKKMEDILSQIHGAGKVEVLLTVKTGEEKLYQTNTSSNISDVATDTDTDTVTITDAQRNEQGLIKQIISPTYLGAIIVCQGADQPTVRWAVIDAVSKITGLGADKISILKMK